MIELRLPAHLSFLAAVRTCVGAVAADLGCDEASEADLRLAADEAAAIVITDAVPWSDLELAIAHDDTDVYVRLAAKRQVPERPLDIERVSQMLLDGAVESHHVSLDDDRVLAVLQRPITSTKRA